ncbi:MAG: FIST C-terminal domain-containing protein [Rhodospirillales bacterium]|nr:FIST C-terminal domain-containing protein [Alphaproteobacteria bacterium]USO03939.1 MAG: FIST C-terminal domain-containing protein [Rhodospirillales bacterium]
MTLFRSTQFASAAASGHDWRECSKKVLEALESARTKEDGFNMGLLYITDALAEDAASIITLFRSVTGIEVWTGCVGLGVVGVGEEFVDGPAISAMIGRQEEGQVKPFFFKGKEAKELQAHMSAWLEEHDPMLVLAHGDPFSDPDPADMLGTLEKHIGGFVAGGILSSRKQPVLFGQGACEGGISGLAFDTGIPVATGLSQGCAPIGGEHEITKADEHVILELDGRRAFDVFTESLRALTIEQTGIDPDQIVVESGQIEDCSDIPKELRALFEGGVHVAFPVSGSDMKDYMVRNLVGVDPEDGAIAVSHPVTTGQRIFFVHRSEKIVREDLSHSLVSLRGRVQQEYGAFEPKGAVYISCAGRAFSGFSGREGGEMALVREVIGDVPLCGFYAGGEISGGHLYSYVGVLILFL